MKASEVCVGDLLVAGDDYYILGAVSGDSWKECLGLTLIGLRNGNRYSGTVIVEHLPMPGSEYRITPDQLDNLCGGCSDSFTHIARRDCKITVAYYAVTRIHKVVEVGK